jgi:hypothetical protein
LLQQRDHLRPSLPQQHDLLGCNSLLQEPTAQMPEQVIFSPQRWRKGVSLPGTSRPSFTAEQMPPPRKFSEENSPTIVVTDCDGGAEEDEHGNYRPFHFAISDEFAQYRLALRPESPFGGSVENMRRISESSSFDDGWDPAGGQGEEPGSPQGTSQEPAGSLAAFFTRTSGLPHTGAQLQVNDLRSDLEHSFQGFQIGDLGQKGGPPGLGLDGYQSPALQAEFFSVSSVDSATLTDLDELMKSELQKL